jgi:RHS repeat-associated protein
MFSGHTYDDKNRLVTVEREEVWRAEFEYEGVGRLRVRKEYDFLDDWTLAGETRYIYDGWRVVQERDGNNTPTVSYTRGTDLSGSLEGAGGIGGLLARSHGYSGGTGNWSTHNCYHADGNGNITYVVNSSVGLAASYRYDSFGNTLASSGRLAGANGYRFSSKELHVRSGLYYYGYRWYDSATQRWVSRDPIMERGGINLYVFVGQDPASVVDPHGLGYGNPVPPVAIQPLPPIKQPEPRPHPPPTAWNLPLWPPAKPFPSHPASLDKDTGISSTSGNGLVMCPAKPLNPCTPGITPPTPSRPSKRTVVRDCPCTGKQVLPCTEHEECVIQSMAPSGPVGAMKTVYDCPCPEYAL